VTPTQKKLQSPVASPDMSPRNSAHLESKSILKKGRKLRRRVCLAQSSCRDVMWAQDSVERIEQFRAELIAEKLRLKNAELAAEPLVEHAPKKMKR
jgi:hypothetical protein